LVFGLQSATAQPRDALLDGAQDAAPPPPGSAPFSLDAQEAPAMTRPSKLLSTVAAGAAVAAMALTGCTAKNTDASASADSHGQGRVAFMMPDLITPRWDAQDRVVFEEQAKESCSDCEVTYYNAKGDAGTQLSQVQAAIANGVDVIVLAPADKTAAVNMVNLAHDAGVKVISYATNIDNPDVDYIVTTDVPKIGAQQSQSLIDGLAEQGITSGNLIVINGDPSDDFGFRYKSGAHSVLDSSGFTIAAEYDAEKWDGTNAQRQMDQAITAVGKDNFVGVYAANDDLAGGVIAAMKNAGIDPATRLVTGQDGSAAGLQRVIAGEQYNTINLPIKVFAAKTAELAVALAKGEEPSAEIVNGKSAIPSGAEIDAYIYPTEVITVENISNMIEPDGFWKLEDICTDTYRAACQQAGLL
jgi:D-xylose transport system substrate-binding protein